MTIKVGDKIPSIGFSIMTGDGPKGISSKEIFANKKVVLTHLPGFVVNAEAILDKGVDTIACMSVNDAFVMGAWSADQNAENILMLADGNGEFTSELGLANDMSGFGMGRRAKRFGIIVENEIVTYLGIEEPGEIKVSSAEHMLEIL